MLLFPTPESPSNINLTTGSFSLVVAAGLAAISFENCQLVEWRSDGAVANPASDDVETHVSLRAFTILIPCSSFAKTMAARTAVGSDGKSTENEINQRLQDFVYAVQTGRWSALSSTAHSIENLGTNFFFFFFSFRSQYQLFVSLVSNRFKFIFHVSRSCSR